MGVIPAKAGIRFDLCYAYLDPGLRRGDGQKPLVRDSRGNGSTVL